MTIQKLGGTVIVMEKFDAEAVLALIERYRVTHAQFVPTHFIRMLKLPAEVRARYDHSSLQVVYHAASPCPVEVKHAMMDWWGGRSSTNSMPAPKPTALPRSVRRTGWPIRALSVARSGARCASAGKTAKNCRPAKWARSISPMAHLSNTTATRRRPAKAATAMAGPRSAMSAGWMPKAIST
ncbi:AMP-binding protein [Novosphingobium colocasiae]